MVPSSSSMINTFPVPLRTPQGSHAMFIGSCLISLVLTISTLAASDQGLVARLDDADFIGSTDGNLTRFLGIPFAKPPTGSNRFRLPEPSDPYNGTFNATSYGPRCPQQGASWSLPQGFDPSELLFLSGPDSGVPDSGESEDCLTLNVIKPANASLDGKLPVVVWIYGGGFESGSTTGPTGDLIVTRSIELGQPIIHVNMGYRVSAFGFLMGKEAKAAGVGNAGLHDQREALRWVQKYIPAFGGDPDKVTLWGQSAGAVSVATQMIANGGNTEGLFHGAFMESGVVLPRGDMELGQQDYDNLVQAAGCAGNEDTLECLRGAPLSVLKEAMDSLPGILSHRSLNLTWAPRADGTFLEAPLQQSLLRGNVANIPFVTGNCDDEGTFFSLVTTNVTTDAEFEEYIHDNYFSSVDSDDFQKVVDEYPSDVTQGSPYGTGTQNALTPQFKRIASIQGDLTFQGPRRLFLEQLASRQNAWSYVSNTMKTLPYLGSGHGTDLYGVYKASPLATALINFVNHFDPNGASGTDWPKYSLDNPKNFVFGPGNTSVQDDTYRQEAISVLNSVLLQHPI